MERVRTVVIGAGQAGLSMSYHLTRLGVEHVMLERGRIAERWRSERWDSLVFQFPNWMLRLPGHGYQGDEPEGFMPRAGIVGFLEDYARRIRPPIRCGVRVTGLRRVRSGHLRVETDAGSLDAPHVVVATGPYQRPVVPALGNALPASTWQITANCYTASGQLPPGGVLVIGSGGSGSQIAEDLLQSGRRVFLSVGRHRRVPRRYRGKDFGWWQEQTGAADRVVEGPVRQQPAPLLTGVAGGHDADLRLLARQGVRLLGSLGAVSEGRLRFVDDLQENLAKGDESYRQFMREADDYVVRNRLTVPEAPHAPVQAAAVDPSKPPDDGIDLEAEGITCVIWAVGYRFDFGWIRCGALDAQGRPVHHRGISPVPGLYFLGLPRLHTVKSAFLWGVGDDAAYLADRIRACG